MSSSNATILRVDSYVQREALATVAIKPGMLIELVAAGGVKPHATTEVYTVPRFAIEGDCWGKTTDDNFAIGDTVPYVKGLACGSEVNAILAVSQTIVVGDKLTSNGDGSLKKAVVGTDVIIAEAEEAVTTTSATARIAVSVA